MKTAYFLLLASVISAASETVTIAPGQENITQIVVNKDSYTSLKFPSKFSMVYGKGITVRMDQGGSSSDKKVSGLMEVLYTQDKPVLVLEAILPNFKTVMTVYMNGRLYLFQIVTGPNPTLALEFSDGAAPSKPVSTKIVVESRPRYDSELLLAVANWARMAPLIRDKDPEDYQGYQVKECDYVSEGQGIRTAVRRVHRFPREDAIVIEGNIRNGSQQPLRPKDPTIAIGNIQYPITYFDCQKPILPNSSASFLAEIVGGLDFQRTGISIDQEFRLIIQEASMHKEQATPTPSPSPKS